MKYSLNTPLTHTEVKRLPLGFTQTSFGPTGQEIKHSQRLSYPHTNTKLTMNGKPRRGIGVVQYVPDFARNEDGTCRLDQNGNPIVRGYKQIWHKNFGHILNKQ